MRFRVRCLLVVVVVLAFAPNAHATFSGANGRIAFERGGQVLVMDPDGTDERVLAANGGDPAWSPDGTKVAYHVSATVTCGLGATSAWQIRIVNADGTGDHALTGTPSCSQSAAEPSWSPDGTKIVYDDSVGGDAGQVTTVAGHTLSIIPSAGGTAQRISLPVTFRFLGRPAWSPSGNRIAFSAETPGEANEDIFTVSTTGTGLYRVTTNRRQDFAPTWSPDGARIAYTSERDEPLPSGQCDGDAEPPCNTDVYTVGADGSDLRRITTFVPRIKDSFGVYSPDGKQIVWSSARFTTGDAGLHRTPVAGGQISVLPAGTNPDWQPAATATALTARLGHFEPKGGSTTFRGDQTTAPMQIYLGNPAPAGGTTVTLTSSDPTLADPPPTFTVPAGRSVGTVNVPLGTAPGPIASSQVTLTASLGGRSVSSQLSLYPVAALDHIVLGNPRAEDNVALVYLTSLAPAGGAKVALSSDDPLVKVPATVTVPTGQTQVAFKLFVKEVSNARTATVTATYNGVTRTASVALEPDPQVASITLSPTSVVGGGTSGQSNVTITLDRPVPNDIPFQSPALVVTVTSTSKTAFVHDVRIQPTEQSATFTLSTAAVPATVIATISARSGGLTRSAPLTIRPGNPIPPDQPDVATYSVSPSTIVDGTTATGTVTLTAPAPAGGTTVSFTEGNPAVAFADDQVVPAGQSSITFPVRADYVYPKPLSGTLSARTVKPYTLGTAVHTTVTVTPAPDPPPGPFPG